jgi:hypothetical protein
MNKLPPLKEGVKSIRDYGKDIKLTGIKDTDLLILKELDDKDLFQMCLVNKSVNRACKDENFWRERFIKNFGDLKEYKLETWRQYYLKFSFYTNKYTTFHHLIRRACFIGDLSLVVYAINKKPLSVDTTDNFPLMLATQGEYYEICKYLILHGADVNTHHGSVLVWISAYGPLDMVSFLVEHGANIQLQEDLALRWASKRNKIDIVKYLIEKGANIHSRNEEVLRWFSKHGDLDMVKYLIKLGALPTSQSRTVENAIEGGYLKLVQYLIGSGFDTQYDLDQDHLMKVAVNSFSLPVVKYLVSKSYPVTPEIIEYAKQKKYTEIVDFLLTSYKLSINHL